MKDGDDVSKVNDLKKKTERKSENVSMMERFGPKMNCLYKLDFL